MTSAIRTSIAADHCGVSLDQLFADATRTGDALVRANSCTSDWRQVEPGDVFIALPPSFSNDDDGHAHARDAVERGAVAVVCEHPVPVFDVPTYLVADSRVAFGELCQAVAGHPAASIPVIAVTGTHGKSTTLALLDAIFSLAGKHCGKIGSLGCYDGMSHSGGTDSFSSVELASRLERMVAAGCTHALVEVSSLALSEASFAGVEFDSVCITNVSDAHLDLHNSAQAYRNLKRRILEYLAPEGVAILNVDDPVSSRWIARLEGPTLTFGTKGPAEISAHVVSQHANEQEFVISAGNESVAVRTTIVGEQHISNCLAAAAMALSYGINLQTIAAGIESVERLSGRMELLDCGQGFPVYLDAADTAESLRVALRTARHLAEGRVICVLGAMQSATHSEELAIEHVVRRLADLAIVAREFHTEEQLVQDSQQHAVVEVVADRREAIACAVAMADVGDVVVIAGTQAISQRAFGMLEVDRKLTEGDIVRQLLVARQQSYLRIAG